MTLSEKSAYLKGLMDGLKLDTEKDEGKMIAAIVDMLSDVAETVADLEDVVDTISDELDCIEEDLDNIDDYLLDEDDEDDCGNEDDASTPMLLLRLSLLRLYGRWRLVFILLHNCSFLSADAILASAHPCMHR